MNIEIANRLLEYRKKSGLSQEELADKLNISRQSVSKWERAEASPDTNNLIELAKIYGVTLDELINVDLPMGNADAVTSEKTEKAFPIRDNYEIEDVERTYSYGEKGKFAALAPDGLRIVDNDEKVLDRYSWEDVYIKNEDGSRATLESSNFFKRNEKKSKLAEAINGTLFLVMVFVYVLLCALKVQSWATWRKLWVIFVAYPAIVTLVESIIKKDIRIFAFPVFIAYLYVFFGVYYQWWHPMWVMFLLIPIYYTVISFLPNKHIKINVYFTNSNGEEKCFVVSKGDLYIH